MARHKPARRGRSYRPTRPTRESRPDRVCMPLPSSKRSVSSARSPCTRTEGSIKRPVRRCWTSQRHRRQPRNRSERGDSKHEIGAKARYLAYRYLAILPIGNMVGTRPMPAVTARAVYMLPYSVPRSRGSHLLDPRESYPGENGLRTCAAHGGPAQACRCGLRARSRIDCRIAVGSGFTHVSAESNSRDADGGAVFGPPNQDRLLICQIVQKLGLEAGSLHDCYALVKSHRQEQGVRSAIATRNSSKGRWPRKIPLLRARVSNSFVQLGLLP